MRFSDLYAHVSAQPGPLVSVKALASHIRAHHHDVGQVNFFPVDLNEDKSLGHIVYERERDSPYEGEFTVANIRYSRTLNRCWRRFVCCKELMHVFDTAEERTDTRDKFLRLMKELENNPLKDDISPMLSSEYDAEWMALTILCPKDHRDEFKNKLVAREIDPYDIALAFRIPEVFVGALMSDYYDQAVAGLLA